ncbi:MAG TPA: protein translocase subunit SecDF [Flavobacteriales bacterium]|jgi:SecD/SecF fusion protein|nr:protein translocase subunit SecDF [Flavobacteriales bacterium]|tara:strand:- start:7905 stop:10994 length:3090 start_codon:yes stop_codon:yes gene_type:complete
MQNRNAIKVFTILFAIVCLYQLSFTWVADGVQEDAVEYANTYVESKKEALISQFQSSTNDSLLDSAIVNDYLQEETVKREKYYLDSISSEKVYDIWVKDYTYKDCQEREINLGLDLKGGMNVTLEVSVVDVIKALANYSKDEMFNTAIFNSQQMQKNSQDDFVTLFEIEYEKLSPNTGLAVLFTAQMRDEIKINATNKEVIKVISAEVEDAISRSFNILRSRIDRFGVTQPNIQRLENSGRILVELPGIKEPERARKLLQSTAKLEFWETYEYSELLQSLEDANKYLREQVGLNDTISQEVEEILASVEDKIDVEETALEEDTSANSLLSKLEGDSAISDTSDSQLSFEQFAAENPLYAVLYPNINQDNSPNEGPVVGFCAIKDTVKLNEYLADVEVMKNFPLDVKFAYTVKPYDSDGKFMQLIGLKVSGRDGEASLEGDVVTDARQDFGQFNANPEVSMTMNSEGAKQWKRLTAENIGKSVAIVLDDFVYSFPTVQSEISGGRSQITGNFTINEAKDLANILKSGKLPAPARIIEEAIVGPSLGEEAINAGLKSFIIALMIMLMYMIFYYSGAGVVSNIALLANIFFIFGVLSSIGAVLTLPGIAGIVLTIGMSVDANVLIYERIREELSGGKGIRLAIKDGYDKAYNAIIDANVTTLLTGIILYTFGTGPIKGFATTLIIGILTSLFSAIFITRLVISRRLRKNKEIKFSTKLTEGAFKNTNIDFIGKRKRFYIFSGIIILLGIGSLVTKGLNYGVDFVGGRTYVVRFDDSVDNEKLRSELTTIFIDNNGLKYAPQVKTFGDDNQVKITTKYMIDENSINADEVVEEKLNEGLTRMQMSYEVMSSQKVGPTIADDIKDAAVWSVFFSLLIIFLYILIRFRKWQFSLGAVTAVFHDVLIVLAIFSIFYGIMPFSLEIDQAFIAAILTIIGYSLNDTVVVFDRVREYMEMHKKREIEMVMNNALNSTLSRTINTSMTTFFVLFVIFLFGGEVIRGFMFALMIGVIVGTYSSLFVASPIMLDTLKRKEKE